MMITTTWNRHQRAVYLIPCGKMSLSWSSTKISFQNKSSFNASNSLWFCLPDAKQNKSVKPGTVGLFRRLGTFLWSGSTGLLYSWKNLPVIVIWPLIQAGARKHAHCAQTHSRKGGHLTKQTDLGGDWGQVLPGGSCSHFHHTLGMKQATSPFLHPVSRCYDCKSDPPCIVSKAMLYLDRCGVSPLPFALTLITVIWLRWFHNMFTGAARNDTMAWKVVQQWARIHLDIFFFFEVTMTLFDLRGAKLNKAWTTFPF